MEKAIRNFLNFEKDELPEKILAGLGWFYIIQKEMKSLKFNTLKHPVIFGMMMICLLTACKEEEQTIPELVSLPVKDIDLNTVLSGGKIKSDGGSEVTARGVCWSLESNPEITDFKTADGSGTGEFTSTLGDLFENTNYYLRAYATNSLGTAYGQEIAFATGALTDPEGNVYHTISIGDQVWMLENLRTSKFNDGTEIPYITSDAEWADLAGPGYSWCNNNKESYSELGALYNWHSIAGGKLCPPGWHIPSLEEWTVLVEYFTGFDGSGAALKEKGTEHWMSPNTGAENTSGFTAVSGSFRNYLDGTFGSFGYFCYMWSEETDAGLAASVLLQFNNTEVKFLNLNKGYGLFVRCIQDNPE